MGKPRSDGAVAAKIARVTKRCLQRGQVFGMRQFLRRQPFQRCGIAAQQLRRRGAGETDAPIGRMTGDEVGRILRQKAPSGAGIHHRAALEPVQGSLAPFAEGSLNAH